MEMTVVKKRPNAVVAWLQNLWRSLSNLFVGTDAQELQGYRDDYAEAGLREVRDNPEKVEIELLIMKTTADNSDWTERTFDRFGECNFFAARNRKNFLHVTFITRPMYGVTAVRRHETGEVYTTLKKFAQRHHPYADVSSLWTIIQSLAKDSDYHINKDTGGKLVMVFKTDQYSVEVHVRVE